MTTTMNQQPHFDPWRDKHSVNMDPDIMDKFSADESLFAGEPSECIHAMEDALDNLPNLRYRKLLVGIYRERKTIQQMAQELDVTLPNFYNLHRRALTSLKAHMK